ncbi:MAG: methylmalonyl-CoA mutase family protein [Bacteroidota bacterium]
MADAFSQIDKATWLAKVEKDLKGRALEELTWPLPEGIEITPFAHAEDLPSALNPIRRPNNQWEIGETFLLGDDPKAANRQLLAALSKGVNSPLVVLSAMPSEIYLEQLLQEVHLGYIHFGIELAAPGDAHSVATMMRIHLTKHYTEQPISWSLSGISNTTNASMWKGLLKAGTQSPKLALVDARPWFGNREGVVEELSKTTRGLIQVLETAQAADLDLSQWIKNVRVQLQVGTSYFLEIAKIRALKHLMANVLQSFQLQGGQLPEIDAYLAPQAYHEEIHTNKIRATSMAMSAVIAGVDRLTVLPSDGEEGANADDFSRRVARNVQHVLMLESHLDHVVDPAAGSYYLENLTQQLAVKAWEKV